MVADAVRMCTLSLSELRSETKRDSYQLVYSPDIEQEVFEGKYDAVDNLWQLYHALSEGSGFESLTVNKLLKLPNHCKSIGKKPLKKIDVEIFFKKFTSSGRPVNFKCFCEMMCMMVDKMDDSPFTLGEKLNKFFESFSYKLA